MNRDTGQIMFDFNNENVEETFDIFDSTQLKYRKSEMISKKCSNFILLVTSVIFVYNSIHYYVYSLKSDLYGHSIFWIIELFLLTFFFCKLTFLMRTRHNYEYQVHKKSLCLVYLFTATQCVMGIFLSLGTAQMSKSDIVTSAFNINLGEYYYQICKQYYY